MANSPERIVVFDTTLRDGEQAPGFTLDVAAKVTLARALDALRLARRFTDDVEFSAEDATRSDPEFLCRVIEAVIREGGTTINLPDTVGYGTPEETREFFASVRARVPNADRAVFSAHCHDD